LKKFSVVSSSKWCIKKLRIIPNKNRIDNTPNQAWTKYNTEEPNLKLPRCPL
jgi:hypothetical protein